ncbi:polysaccharide deacetylase family protein [Paenibacillus donghaensis]|uniref:polysaccharide deacetylase family protein n=1 Tax=Paenibacillus donghaensis TaxID=414771 RepID=UPI0018840D44|nr:polysaccharide deacetylase family protein [Paenibacillus donghaensis]MBE9913772.1 polysaccharide deacetylase family protein [Paenibacillus donghaensis]
MKRTWMIIAGVSAVLTVAIGIVLVKGPAFVRNDLKQGAGMEQPVPVQPIGHKDNALSIPKQMGVDEAETPRQFGSVLPGSKISLQDTSLQNENPKRIHYRNKVIALMYHEVTPGQKNKQSLNVEKFKRQLDLMKEGGFQWITMNQYVQFVMHNKPVPPNAVLMTFDDGYESFYEDVYPLLLEYHVPATSFLIVNAVDNPKHIGIPKLTWEQIKEMHLNGVDFYSHSFDSHMYAPLDAAGKRSKAVLRGPIYIKQLGRKESKEEYIARVRSDMERANAVLREKIGNTMNVIAFPYGVFSPALLRVCKELDTPVSFTVLPGINRPGGLNGYRINAGGADNDPEALIALMKNGGMIAGKQPKGGIPGLKQKPITKPALPPARSGSHRMAVD